MKGLPDSLPPRPLQSAHVFSDDALGDLDAVGVAESIRRKDISVREAIDAAISRTERIEPVLNAVQFADFDRARNVSTTALGESAFAGVPTFFKDNVNVKGLPTTRGSTAFSPTPAPRSDRFVEQFLDLGFAVLGKSRLPEFGFNASTEFSNAEPTRNPWHTEFSAGASSGGAAALVASGAVPIAHANDGGGSIRIPAAACGLVGLKPTRGRVRTEFIQDALPVRIISDGVLARSVRDVAMFYEQAELVYRNPKLLSIGAVRGPSKRRLRVGVIRDSVLGQVVDAPTLRAVDGTARTLTDLGHHVGEAQLPVGEDFARAFLHYWGMLSVIITAPGRWIHGRDFNREHLDSLTLGLAQHYWKQVHQTPAALYRLRKSVEDVRRSFEQWDVIVSPVVSHTTPPIGYLSPRHPFEELLERLTNYVAFTPVNNAAGNPGLSLPCGVTDEGLPIGVHFSAQHGDERTLLELAFELEQAHPWRRINAN
ncbi:amidase [Hoyosella rhizosphaerae]|uniref:amidase n=1 Tax=Hoyosella rhizosphaerae TaxID=1755582 RepID=A0A916U4X9_9ACTN|nr:amidase [Hoyosella rhizosphaerae]MBN4926472.1 amidase [Hoyosella rhizosphaerae]GGC59088.1 putative amidase AmiC [Hoyosella rhizosphaerae]